VGKIGIFFFFFFFFFFFLLALFYTSAERIDSNFSGCSCIDMTLASAAKGLKFIQLIEAVFDYYGDTNVKARHLQAFRHIKDVMYEFEKAFQLEKGRSIAGHMQQAWARYLTQHLDRVAQFARNWAQAKLEGLRVSWYVLHPPFFSSFLSFFSFKKAPKKERKERKKERERERERL